MSRLLFTAAGGHGHLQPLLPLAEQAAADGHEVLVTGAASLGLHVDRRGLAWVPSGPDLRPIVAPLVVHDLEQEQRAVGSWFVARLGRARAVDLLDLCRSWRPDVVVRDEMDIGSAVAAEAAGVPHAAVVVIGAGGFLRPDVLREPLDGLLAEHGLDMADPMELLHRHLTLTPFPASFRDPADPLPGRVIGYGLPAPRGAGPTTRRSVYVTLGTIFNTESGDLLRTAVLGAAACPGVERVLASTGEHVDPMDLEPLPEQVVVERFVDQDRVLGECHAVVSHAGSGTVLDALRHGLPSVALPMGADQLLNARRLQELGLGVPLQADVATPADVTAALHEVLASVAMADSVQAVRTEIAALPSVPEAVAAVTALAR